MRSSGSRIAFAFRARLRYICVSVNHLSMQRRLPCKTEEWTSSLNTALLETTHLMPSV